jgi:hypothetical protein
MIMVYFAYLIVDNYLLLFIHYPVEPIDNIINLFIDDRDLAFAFSCSCAFSLEGNRPVFFLCWLSRKSRPV